MATASYRTLPNKTQIALIFISRFIEPFTFACIIPFTYYLVKDLGYTDTSTASYLSTCVITMFAFGQATSAVFWARFGDKFGRKPVVLLGLVGLALSILIQGLTRNIYTILACRFLGGFISGNAGVMRTIVSELAYGPDRVRAYGILQLGANVGGLAGPILGAYLADPIKNHPGWAWVSHYDEFLAQYPYFLASAAPVPVILLTAGVACFALQETLDSDPANQPLIQDKPEKKPLNQKAFYTVYDYGLLSAHIAAFLSMFPLFLSAPQAKHGYIYFSGGLELSENDLTTVFIILAVLGVVMQIGVYPQVAEWIGVERVHRLGTWLYLPPYALTPYATWCITDNQSPPPLVVLTIIIVFISAARAFTMAAMDVLITNSATSANLSRVNSIAQTVHCVTSFIGTLVLGYMYSFGIKLGVIGMGWWVMSLVVIWQLYIGSKHATMSSSVINLESHLSSTLS